MASENPAIPGNHSFLLKIVYSTIKFCKNSKQYYWYFTWQFYISYEKFFHPLFCFSHNKDVLFFSFFWVIDAWPPDRSRLSINLNFTKESTPTTILATSHPSLLTYFFSFCYFELPICNRTNGLKSFLKEHSSL